MSNIKNKFGNDEIVKVISLDKSLKQIHGKVGIIRCVNKDEATNEDVYTISVDGICWGAYERDIESTGEFSTEEYLTNVTLRAQVTPEGEGILKEVIIKDEEETKDL